MIMAVPQPIEYYCVVCMVTGDVLCEGERTSKQFYAPGEVIRAWAEDTTLGIGETREDAVRNAKAHYQRYPKPYQLYKDFQGYPV